MTATLWRLVGLLSGVACLVAAVRIYTGAMTSVVPAWLAGAVGGAVLADLVVYWRWRKLGGRGRHGSDR